MGYSVIEIDEPLSCIESVSSTAQRMDVLRYEKLSCI